jgi:hypothetical protein
MYSATSPHFVDMTWKIESFLLTITVKLIYIVGACPLNSFFIVFKIRFEIYLETFLWGQILFYKSAQTRHLALLNENLHMFSDELYVKVSKTLKTSNHSPICLYPWFFTGQTWTCLVINNKNKRRAWMDWLTCFFQNKRIIINLQGLNTITIGIKTNMLYRKYTIRTMGPTNQTSWAGHFVLINKFQGHLHSKFEILETTLTETGKEI